MSSLAAKWGRFGGEGMDAPTPSPRPTPGTGERARSPGGVPSSFFGKPNGASRGVGGYAAQTPQTPSTAMTPVQLMDEQNSNDVQEVQRQVAQWDEQMDSLDKKQEQLVNEQWGLLRTQISSLMGALSEMRVDMNNLKTNTVGKEMEKVIENMVMAHDSHDKNHAGIMDRIAYLENFAGESADKHDGVSSKHATLETRLEFMEGLLGDNADKHAAMVAELQKQVDGCTPGSHHAAMQATLETRMDYMEGLLGDNADKHAAMVADLKKQVDGCTPAEHHAGMQARMEYLETFLGESADKHEQALVELKKASQNGIDAHEDHKMTMETRLEYLESLLGDSADKHTKEIEEAQKKMTDLHAAIANCAKTENHATLEDRMGYLESFLGESADKHDKELKELKDHKDASSAGMIEHKTSMETRLEYLEGLLGDSSDKHADGIEAAHSKIADLHAVIASCAKAEHHASLQQRLDYLEKFLGESADRNEKDLAAHKAGLDGHKTSMETRLEYMEALLGDNADKHSKEIDALKAAHALSSDAIGKCAQADHHSTVEQRVNYLEKFLGESADKQEKDLAAHKEAADGHKTTMEQRIEFVEGMLGDNADKHTKELAAQKDAHNAHKQAMQKSLQDLDPSGLHGKLEELQNNHANMENLLKQCARGDSHSLLDKRVAASESKHSLNTEKLSSIERLLADGEENNTRKLASFEAVQMKLKNSSDEQGSLLREEKATRLSSFQKLDERLGCMENFVNDPLDKHINNLEITQSKVRDMIGKFEQQRVTYDNNKHNMDHRLNSIEISLNEGNSMEVARELNQRMQHMQEDEKRARDVLMSSITEQLRLEQSAMHSQACQVKEQWDREQKTRQAHTESFQELLGQERGNRDLANNQLSERVLQVERKVWGELFEPPHPAQIIRMLPQGVVGGLSPMMMSTGNLSPRSSLVTQAPTIMQPTSIQRMSSVTTIPGIGTTQTYKVG